MPLTSRTKLYRTLPSCFADHMSSSSARQRGDSSSGTQQREVLGNNELMVSGESKRALGRPPHCGPRRVRRHNNNNNNLSSAGSTFKQLSTPRSNSPAFVAPPTVSLTYHAAGDVKTVPSSNSVVLSSTQDTSELLSITSTTSSTSSKTASTVLPPVIDENLVNLLNSYTIRGDTNISRPSSAGSSNSGRKRSSPLSPQPVTLVGINSSSPIRYSPRTAISLDNVDLWDDSSSDLSGSASAAVVSGTAAYLRRTVNLGGSSPTDPSTSKNRLTVDIDGWRSYQHVKSPSRKLIRRIGNNVDDSGSAFGYSDRMMQRQRHHRRVRFDDSSTFSMITQTPQPEFNSSAVVRRTHNGTLPVVGRIPHLVESSGRPMTASRPATADGSAAAAVRLNFHDSSGLRLHIRGVQMTKESPTSTVSVETEATSDPHR